MSTLANQLLETAERLTQLAQNLIEQSNTKKVANEQKSILSDSHQARLDALNKRAQARTSKPSEKPELHLLSLPKLSDEEQSKLDALKSLPSKTEQVISTPDAPTKSKRAYDPKITPKMSLALFQLAHVVKAVGYREKSKKGTNFMVIPVRHTPKALLNCYRQKALTNEDTGRRIAYEKRWRKLGLKISTTNHNVLMHPKFARLLSQYA